MHTGLSMHVQDHVYPWDESVGGAGWISFILVLPKKRGVYMKELSLMLYKQQGPRVVCTHLEGPGPLRREYRNHVLTLTSEWKIWGRHLRKEYPGDRRQGWIWESLMWARNAWRHSEWPPATWLLTADSPPLHVL